jgi:hypothetical protein
MMEAKAVAACSPRLRRYVEYISAGSARGRMDLEGIFAVFSVEFRCYCGCKIIEYDFGGKRFCVIPTTLCSWIRLFGFGFDRRCSRKT